MDKTNGCYIISELNGNTLNVNTKTNKVELSNGSNDLWKKHNWITEKVRCDQSNPRQGVVEIFSLGHLWNINAGAISCNTLNGSACFVNGSLNRIFYNLNSYPLNGNSALHI